MTTRRPRFDQVLEGIRVRVYATKDEYEVIFNNDDIDDMAADVRCYPKMGGPEAWAHQGRLEYAREGNT